MSHIQYGGDGSDGGVFLNVTQVLGYKRQAVMAGSDYLYTRHEIAVRAVFNPATQQELLPGKPFTYSPPGHVQPPIPLARVPANTRGPLQSLPLPPHFGNGNPARPAVYTAEACKHTLMQPRLRLHWWGDGQTIVQCPHPGLFCDENNGPTPVSCDVHEMHGGKTWLVDWVVVCHVNESPLFSRVPHPVLSHQYSQSEDLDQDFYRTVTTEGEVIFSTSVLRTPGAVLQGQTLSPDDLRAQVMVPIPQTMKRESVLTKVSPDGTRLLYKIVDREKALQWDEEGVTRIVASHELVNEVPPMHIDVKPLGIGLQLDMLKVVARGAVVEKRVLKALTDLLPAKIGDAVNLGVNRVLNIRAGALALTATSTHVVQIELWGVRGTSRNTMEQFAREIVTDRIVPVKVGFDPLRIKSQVWHDLTMPHIKATEVYLTGPSFPLGGSLPSRDAFGNQTFGRNNNTGQSLVENAFVTIPGPPYDGKSRGTHIERLVHSALSKPSDPSPNVPPAAPPAAPVDTSAVNYDRPLWPRPAHN